MAHHLHAVVSSILLVFTITYVQAGGHICDVAALNTCITQARPDLELPAGLVTAATANDTDADIIAMKPMLCQMTSEDFGALVSCADAQHACADAFFGDTSPVELAQSPDMMILKQYGDQNAMIALLFEMVCDDSCEKVFTEMNDDDSSEDEDANSQEPCQAESIAYALRMASYANASADVKQQACSDFEIALDCMVKVTFDEIGSVGDCNTFVKNLDSNKLAPMLTGPLTNKTGDPDGDAFADFTLELMDDCNVDVAAKLQQQIDAMTTDAAGMVKMSLMTMLAALIITKLF